MTLAGEANNGMSSANAKRSEGRPALRVGVARIANTPMSSANAEHSEGKEPLNDTGEPLSDTDGVRFCRVYSGKIYPIREGPPLGLPSGAAKRGEKPQTDRAEGRARF